MTDLDLTGINPRPRDRPELVAVGAVGIRERIDDGVGVLAAVAYPCRGLELRPRLLILRAGDDAFERLGGHVLALRIDHRAQNRVLAIRGQIDRHGSALKGRGIAGQTGRCIEGIDDLQATIGHRGDRLGKRDVGCS